MLIAVLRTLSLHSAYNHIYSRRSRPIQTELHSSATHVSIPPHFVTSSVTKCICCAQREKKVTFKHRWNLHFSIRSSLRATDTSPLQQGRRQTASRWVLVLRHTVCVRLLRPSCSGARVSSAEPLTVAGVRMRRLGSPMRAEGPRLR